MKINFNNLAVVFATISSASLVQFAFVAAVFAKSSVNSSPEMSVANAEVSQDCRIKAEYWGGKINEALGLYRHQEISANSYVAIRQAANRNAAIAALECQTATASEISQFSLQVKNGEVPSLSAVYEAKGKKGTTDSTAEFMGIFERAKAGLLSQANYLDSGMRDRSFLESWLHDQFADIVADSSAMGRPSEKQRAFVAARVKSLKQALETRWLNMQFRGSVGIGSGYASLINHSAGAQLIDEYNQLCGSVFEPGACHGVERDQY